VTGGCRILHNEELHNLNVEVKENEMGMACSKTGAQRNAFRILVGKPELKRPLGRPRRRWVDHIKMDFREIGGGGMDWIAISLRIGTSGVLL
jgi:hypothetical protein